MLSWTEKYRPRKWDDFVGQKKTVKILRAFLENKTIPNLLFYGHFGSGKTSLMELFLREFYETDVIDSRYVQIFNASDDRGLDTVRETIFNFVNTKSLFENKLKFVILDEADYMLDASQFLLRNIIDKYSDGVRFILICNYVAKIQPSLKNKFCCLRFSKLEDEYINQLLDSISIQESIPPLSDVYRNWILIKSQGDIRKSITMFQWLISRTDKRIEDHEDEINTYYIIQNSMNTTELRGVLDRSMMNNDLKMFLARRIFQFAIENSKVPVCKKVYELQNMINGDKSDLIIRGFFTSILAELDGVRV
jgi:DNA polymerase III delta prime subunit